MNQNCINVTDRDGFKLTLLISDIREIKRDGRGSVIIFKDSYKIKVTNSYSSLKNRI